MSVENEVANLTTSVDTLTEAVNVKKQTLDNSVAAAETARDTTTGLRDEAAASESAAAQSATEAATSATEAATARDDAVAVVYSGDATLEPAPGSIPVADSDSQITPKWIGSGEYPTIRPSLNLDFANTKSLDPRIDFTRATTATYYDGETFAKAEENLCRYSEDFNNSVWYEGSDADFSFDSGVDAPDGSSGVYRYFEASGGNGFAEFGQGVISGPVPSRVNANFSFLSESFDSVDVGIDNTSVTSLPNGWFRISATAFGYTASIHVKDAGHGQITIGWSIYKDLIRFVLDNNGNDIAQGVYVWGAQIEERSQLTAYTPTTDQPITNYIPVLETASTHEPRFDHDPVTGESKGLLIEEQRTNLLTYSEQFDNAAWGKVDGAVVDRNILIGPDGQLSASNVRNDSGSSSIFQTVSTIAAAQKYTISVYTKKGNNTFFRLSGAQNTGGGNFAFYGFFNLDTGEVGQATEFGTATVHTHRLDDVGNGWFRCSVTFSVSDSYSSMIVIAAPVLSDGSLATEVGLNVNLSKAQFEQGSFPTSYIKTEGSQVTRVADSASITGENFSEWYRQDEGTAYLEFIPVQDNDSNSSIGVVFNDGTDNNWINMGQSSAFQAEEIGSAVKINGSFEVISLRHDDATIETGVPYKQAIAYNVNDFASSYGGGNLKTESSGTLPVVNEFEITRGANGADTPNGYITKFAYYPKRLPNAVLQTLTEE